MDFDTVHRDNLGDHYSNPFDENPYIPQTDDHPGFSSLLSHRVHNLNNLMVEGSSWNPNSNNNSLYSSFNDPFDPFQACFGKLNQDYITGYCTPFAQEYAPQNYHVQSRIRFMDNIVNADHSRTPFLTMDHEYDQMNEGFDHFDEKNNSPNGKSSDKGSCVIVDGDDGNRKRNGAKQNAKRKRIIDNKTEIIKGQWTPEEDGLLVKLVEKHGVRKWSSIAQMLPGRIGKQCRERWHNHLKPNIKKDRWSEEEDRILIEAHRQLGNKWAEIARSLPGRSENTIKNHWNATKRRQLSSRRNNNNSKSNNSPLQKYIKSLISNPDEHKKGGGGYLDNSSSGSASPSMVVTNNKQVLLGSTGAKLVKNGNIDESIFINGEGDDQESLKMLPNYLMDSDQLQFDLQKEMDFMEMLSYGYI
ncbi:hypothetical protein OROHE_017574 [Orobanche hederae]